MSLTGFRTSTIENETNPGPKAICTHACSNYLLISVTEPTSQRPRKNTV